MTEPDYVRLAFRLRSCPPFERRKSIAWWIEATYTDLSGDAKRAHLESLDTSFNEFDKQWDSWATS